MNININMNKESKKAFIVGLTLSAVCFPLIKLSIDYHLHPAIYFPVVIGSFFGLLFTAYGITNSGNKNDHFFSGKKIAGEKKHLNLSR